MRKAPKSLRASGECCEGKDGKLGNSVKACTLVRVHSKGDALPYVGLEDIIGGTGEFTGSTTPKRVQTATFKFTSDHILYGRLRPYLNKVFLPDFSGHCSTEIFPIMPASGVDRRYLYYWLSMGWDGKRYQFDIYRSAHASR